MTIKALNPNESVSPYQERFWYADELGGDDTLFTVPVLVRVQHPYSAHRLHSAIVKICDANPVIYSRFYQSAEGVRVAFEPSEILIEEIGPEISSPASQQLSEMLASTTFSMRRGKLYRFLVCVTDENEFIVGAAFHHSIFDGWSMAPFARELVSLYTTGEFGASSHRSYAIASTAITRQINDQQERLLEYWRTRLRGLTLFTDVPNSSETDLAKAGRTLPLEITGECLANAERVCAKIGLSPFMYLLSCFYLLIRNWESRDDFVVYSPLSVRHTEDRNTIGCFLNTVPIRLNKTAEYSLSSWLRLQRTGILEDLAHSHLPLDRIIADAKVDRVGTKPTLEFMFSFQNTPATKDVIPGAELLPIRILAKPPMCSLGIALERTNGGFVGEIEFDTRLWTDEAIYSLRRNYLEIISQVSQRQEHEIRCIDFLPSDEKTKLLSFAIADNCSDGTKPIPSIITGFLACVKMFPHLPAVRHGELVIDYATIDQMSTAVASNLMRLGIRKGCRIGVCIERQPELIAMLLGAWKIGAIYIPLDPDHPSGRLSLICHNANMSAIVTSATTSGLVSPPDGTMLFDIDHLLQGIPDFAIACIDQLDLTAYIIYTTGTTGTPKGVMVSHEAISCAASAWLHHYRLEAGWHHLQTASVAFDVFMGDVVRCITSGGCLNLADRDILLFPDRLLNAINTLEINFLEIVPAVAKDLMRYAQDSQQKIRAVNIFVVGSDRWRIEDHKQLLAVCEPSTRVVNSYGLTETAVDSTYFEATEPHRIYPEAALIVGRPMSHADIYILNKDQKLTPLGGRGEVYIGGPGVGQGYWNNPDLTGQRFVESPFDSGTKLFRTGDIGRWTMDGQLELLGRADDQIKIRGIRIELSELESVIERVPGVSDVVVVPFRSNDKLSVEFLAAYYVSDPRVGVESLLNNLRQHVPKGAIPSRFYRLNCIPRNLNGKIDRAALRASALEQVAAQHVPMTDTERRIAAIWSELGVVPNSPNDDFFELGGHSLLAAKLVYRLESVFRLPLTYRDIWEFSSLSGLAGRIMAGDKGSSYLFPFNETKSAPTLFLVHPSSGNAMCYRPLANAVGGICHTVGISAPYSDKFDEPRRFRDFAETYADAILASSDLADDIFVGGWSDGGMLALELAHTLTNRGKSVRGVIVIDSSFQRIASSVQEELVYFLSELVPLTPNLASSLLKHLDLLGDRVKLTDAVEWLVFANLVTDPNMLNALEQDFRLFQEISRAALAYNVTWKLEYPVLFISADRFDSDDSSERLRLMNLSSAKVTSVHYRSLNHYSVVASSSVFERIRDFIVLLSRGT